MNHVYSLLPWKNKATRMHSTLICYFEMPQVRPFLLLLSFEFLTFGHILILKV